MTQGGRPVAVVPFGLAAVLVPAVFALPASAYLWAPDALPGPAAPAAFICFFALYYGLSSYALLGLPAFWLCLRSAPPSPGGLAKQAVIANAASPAVMFAQAWVAGEAEGTGELFLFIMLGWSFGFVGAALCGALFAVIYRATARLPGPPAA